MSEFLAEAAVLIQADARSFRADLLAKLKTATAGVTVEVPVVVAGGATASAAAAAASARKLAQEASAAAVAGSVATTTALEAESAAASQAGIAEGHLAKQRATAATIGAAYAKVEQALATARLEVLGAATEAEASEIKLQRQVAAGVAARELLTTAELQGGSARAFLATETVKTSLALERDALATRANAAAHEQAAAAAAHHGVQLRNLGRGAGTAALASIGLRGATLTANAAFIGGAAAAIGFGKAIQTAASFETSLNTFAATATTTNEQLQQVSDTAKQLGQDITLPSVSAQDAADAMLELSKAGLSVQDSIDGARGVLQLATAASIDNAQATQIAASALNAFGLQGDQAVHVADVLANAANQSQGSILDVGLSLQQAAAVARQVGVSFEDTVSLLTLLARNGIKGSDAGTSLRVAFTRLINPTEKARKVLEGLNIQLRDSQGNIRPEVFADFAAAQAGLSKSQQDANAGIVFGTDALRAYSIAAREGLQGLARVRGELDKQGTAAELAGARTKGTQGSFERLTNAASGLGLSIGQDLAGPTSDFIDILAGGLENMTAANEALNNLQNSAGDAAPSFAELAAEAGRLNRALEARGDKAGADLIQGAKDATKALEEQLGPGIAATNMLESYRAAAAAAGQQAAGLANRIDESTDRFAHQAATPPAAPAGPVPIGPTAKQDRAIALAQAAGDLSEVERLQKAALARARRAFENRKGNVKQRTALFQKVTEAEVALATTQSQLAQNAASAQQKAAAERESRARESAAAQQKADQAVLDSFAPAQQKINLAQIDAQATKRLNDNIAVQKLIANTASREIAIIERTVKDMKTRNQQIAARVEIIKQAGAELDRLRKDAADAAVESARNARQVITDTLGKRLQLAQLRGGKDAILAAFDKAIADARKRVAQAKKLGLVQLDEQIALQQLVNDRKSFLDNLEKEVKGQGTTAFDLLKQFSETFNQNAGNLIGGNQPFAGPSGFTADIAQFLIRRPQPARPVTFPGKAADNTLVQSNTSLTRAIVDLTDAIVTQGKGGNTTAGVTHGNPWAGRRWFGDAQEARTAQEG